MIRALALTTLLALPAAPAAAEQLSLTLTPRTAEERQALSLGLAAWSLHRHLENDGSIRQWGRDNAAALRQSGEGNVGAIHQRGRGHRARLDQRGDGNAHAIIQTGKRARARVAQGGGEFGLTIQHGW